MPAASVIVIVSLMLVAGATVSAGSESSGLPCDATRREGGVQRDRRVGDRRFVRATKRVVHRRRDGDRRARIRRGADRLLERLRPVGLIEIAAERNVEDLIVYRRSGLHARSGRRGLLLQTDRNRDCARCAGRRHDALRVGHVAHHAHARCRIVEHAVRVGRERAVARVRRRARAVDVIKDEEPVAVEREVGVDAGRLEATLAELGVDGVDLDAKPEIFGIDAAAVLRRTRRRADLLVELIGKGHALGFEARGRRIGDVVGDHVDPALVCVQTRDPRVE